MVDGELPGFMCGNELINRMANLNENGMALIFHFMEHNS